MSEVIKITVTGIAGTLCAILLRKQVPELAALLTICTGAIILLYCSGAVTQIVNFLYRLESFGELNPGLIKPVLRITGISLITKLASDFCRDAKEGILAAAVETAGGVLALFVMTPLMSNVLTLLDELL